jgi:uncharacterized membrane protein YphA (DoxX/SURF4 family)
MKVLETVLRLGLGGIFLYAGAAKVVDVEAFFWDVHHFELTPWDVSLVLAVFLPWLELLAGGALVVRWLYLGAVALCGGMSAVFLGAVASAWWRGLDITCGCFGREENATNFARHLALNGGMLAAAAVLWWLSARLAKPAR